MKSYMILAFGVVACSVCNAQRPDSAIQDMNARLAAIEKKVGNIEKTGVISQLQVGQEIEQDIDAHALAAKRTVDAVLAELRKRGSAAVPLVKEIEEVMGNQRDQALKMQQRIAAIDGGIRSGKIRLTQGAISQMTPVERREFRRSLRPEVDQQYRKEMPKFFSGGVRHLSDDEYVHLRREACGACEVRHVASIWAERPTPSAAERLFDHIFPTAYAASAYVCYSVCVGSALVPPCPESGVWLAVGLTLLTLCAVTIDSPLR